jgi:hypothetical protein
MFRGELSRVQRDSAWEGKSLAEREVESAYPAEDLNEPTPEQIAFRNRLQREREMDENFGQTGVSERVGRIATNSGSARMTTSIEEDRRKRERDAERARLMAYLAELDRRIGELDDFIAGLNEEIAELDRQIDAGQAVLDAIEGGEYDPDDPAHRAILIELGIDPDQSPSQIEELLRPRMNELHERRGDTIDRRTDAERERDGLIERRSEIQQQLDQGQMQLDSENTASLADRRSGFLEGQGADVELNALDEAQGGEVDDYFADLDNYQPFADEVDPEGAARQPDSVEADAPTQPGQDETRDVTWRPDTGPAGPGAG